jgi:NAD(P)-dependent dehydrogenase (short-subunit alcohol dehydrogenase family)
MGINTFFDFQFAAGAARPSYTLTKNSGTLLMQLIARDVDPAKMQVISFHPGNIFTAPFAEAGFKEEDFPFEKG